MYAQNPSLSFFGEFASAPAARRIAMVASQRRAASADRDDRFGPHYYRPVLSVVPRYLANGRNGLELDRVVEKVEGPRKANFERAVVELKSGLGTLGAMAAVTPKRGLYCDPHTGEGLVSVAPHFIVHRVSGDRLAAFVHFSKWRLTPDALELMLYLLAATAPADLFGECGATVIDIRGKSVTIAGPLAEQIDRSSSVAAEVGNYRFLWDQAAEAA